MSFHFLIGTIPIWFSYSGHLSCLEIRFCVRFYIFSSPFVTITSFFSISYAAPFSQLYAIALSTFCTLGHSLFLCTPLLDIDVLYLPDLDILPTFLYIDGHLPPKKFIFVFCFYLRSMLEVNT